MQDLLPIGRQTPRLFRRIYVMYGEPVDYSEFLDRPRSKETAQAVVDKIMERIRSQHDELRRLRQR
jgi:1-acyl-sn-glycerol-3-phosphate acyltransferase